MPNINLDKIKKAVLKLENSSSFNIDKLKFKALRDVFFHLLDSEGYKPSNYMSYYTYIAENESHEKTKTIGITFDEEHKSIGKEEAEHWIYSGTLKGIDKVIIFTDAQFTSDAFDWDVEFYDPVVLELKSVSDIKNWISSIEADYDETIVTKIIRICTQNLIELIAHNPSKTLIEMEWRDTERVIAELFRGLGFKTTLTPPSKDGGKDVIVELVSFVNEESYIIEIKHWRSQQKVGLNAVKDFLKIVAKEKRAGGLFLSTYGFAENILESLTSIERKMVRYGSEEKIHSLCNTYLKRKSGIWLEDLNLQQALFDGTFH